MNVIVDRRMLKSGARDCFECGKKDYEAIIELGDADDEYATEWEDRHGWFCLPCLKRAVAEAEAAIKADKGWGEEGEALRNDRLSAGLTMGDVARKYGISVVAVSDAELGKTDPSVLRRKLDADGWSK